MLAVGRVIGKHIDTWLVLGALALAPCLWLARGHVLTAGDVVDAELTLITADKLESSCALENAVGAHRCGFRAPRLQFPGVAAAAGSQLQPYVTVDHTLYLVAALFAQPALAQRVEREPPDGRPRDAYRRFRARCRLALLRRVSGAQVQFGPTAAWVPVPPLWVVEPVTCSVVEG